MYKILCVISAKISSFDGFFLSVNVIDLVGTYKQNINYLFKIKHPLKKIVTNLS